MRPVRAAAHEDPQLLQHLHGRRHGRLAQVGPRVELLAEGNEQHKDGPEGHNGGGRLQREDESLRREKRGWLMLADRSGMRR